ncbi:zinc finger protein 271-like isoform X29 [Adelges cooleyi]|uniref:zinc finger protein 271-like isoform X29 n=1 Tax=Adelges cooleyi TaxID=133065 RepID=UPI0021800C96|nr:zinc finger protein 271-like isoform X29 [Adelges cooleyi]
MDNYIQTTKIKIEDENKQSIEQFTKDSEKTTDGDASNDISTCNKTIVKVEVDILGGNRFESVFEYEENDLSGTPTTNDDLDEICTFVCDICKMSFASKKKVTRHITQTHDDHSTTWNSIRKQDVNNKLSDISTCNKTTVKVEVDILSGHRFESVIEIEENDLSGTPTTNHDLDEICTFVCDVCKMSFATKKKVTRHITLAHSDHSTSRNSIRKQVIKNKSSVNGASNEAKNTIESSSTKSILTKHQSVHSGTMPYKCAVCLKSYAFKCSLTNHKRVHTRENSFKCDVCLKSFSRKNKLSVHKRVHTAEKPYKCDVCLKSFSVKSSLTKHERVHIGEKSYKCDVCLKLFSEKSSLTKHERVHTGEKLYKCDVCLNSFSVKSSLTIHKRVHTGEKPYYCAFCLKSFTQKCDLTKHERVHTGVKPYKCDVCLKSFSQKSYLTIHKRVHTGEKPYNCAFCLKSFTQKCDLTKHERVHTGVKPYKCDVCLKSFSHKSSLTVHQRVHTGEKPYKCACVP